MKFSYRCSKVTKKIFFVTDTSTSFDIIGSLKLTGFLQHCPWKIGGLLEHGLSAD